eukprot:1136852-Pelagomonas_calceolata.AAC.3
MYAVEESGNWISFMLLQFCTKKASQVLGVSSVPSKTRTCLTSGENGKLMVKNGEVPGTFFLIT